MLILDYITVVCTLSLLSVWSEKTFEENIQ